MPFCNEEDSLARWQRQPENMFRQGFENSKLEIVISKKSVLLRGSPKACTNGKNVYGNANVKIRLCGSAVGGAAATATFLRWLRDNRKLL